MKYITKLLFVITLLSIIIYIPKVYAMQVSIKKIDGKEFTLEVESSDTIEAVKAKIYEQDDSVPVERLKLIYNGTVLEDGRTLADYEVEKTTTINLEYIEESEEESTVPNEGDLTPPITEENPNTSDNIINSIFLLTISTLGIILSIINFRKKKLRNDYEK